MTLAFSVLIFSKQQELQQQNVFDILEPRRIF